MNTVSNQMTIANTYKDIQEIETLYKHELDYYYYNLIMYITTIYTCSCIFIDVQVATVFIVKDKKQYENQNHNECKNKQPCLYLLSEDDHYQ